MTRVATATILSLILTSTPLGLLAALVIALSTDSSGWWAVGIVVGGYVHMLVSARLEGFIFGAAATAPTYDPAADDNPSDAITPSQRTFLASVDPRAVSHRHWRQFTFPTVLLGLAVAGTLLSPRTTIMLPMGFAMFSIAWLITSVMLMWPLHQRIAVERGMSQRVRIIRQIVALLMFGLCWLLAIGAMVMWIGSSPMGAAIWGGGFVSGAALAVWKRSLVWQPAADELSPLVNQ